MHLQKNLYKNLYMSISLKIIYYKIKLISKQLIHAI